MKFTNSDLATFEKCGVYDFADPISGYPHRQAGLFPTFDSRFVIFRRNDKSHFVIPLDSAPDNEPIKSTNMFDRKYFFRGVGPNSTLWCSIYTERQHTVTIRDYERQSRVFERDIHFPIACGIGYNNSDNNGDIKGEYPSSVPFAVACSDIDCDYENFVENHNPSCLLRFYKLLGQANLAGEELNTVPLPNAKIVYSMYFTPDNSKLVVLAQDWRIFVVDVATGAVTESPQEEAGAISLQFGSRSFGINIPFLTKNGVKSYTTPVTTVIDNENNEWILERCKGDKYKDIQPEARLYKNGEVFLAGLPEASTLAGGVLIVFDEIENCFYRKTISELKQQYSH